LYLLHRIELMFLSWVCVAHHHLHTRMPKKGRQRQDINARHRCPRGPSVA
jgi:hypothetical protein